MRGGKRGSTLSADAWHAAGQGERGEGRGGGRLVRDTACARAPRIRAPCPPRPAAQTQPARLCAQMLRVCDITGKKANNANRVTFSNKHNAYLQYPNLQSKKFFSPSLNRTVRLKVATSTLRTIRKLGLDETAAKYGVDLSKF